MNWHTEYPSSLSQWRSCATASSLTQTLSALNATFTVRVQQLGITSHHTHWDDYALPQTLFCRRVALCLNDTEVVHAQSLCLPHSAWCEVLNCGSTPLGQLLFSGSLKLTRSPLEYAQPEPYVLARRSWFDWQGERLYLSECFLPALSSFLLS